MRSALLIGAAASIALCAGAASAQVYSVNPYSGQVYDPSGAPISPPRAYAGSPPDYRLPTAPDDSGAMDRLDREEALRRLSDIDENTRPQSTSIPDPPPAYDDEDR